MRWIDANTARSRINAWGNKPDAFLFLFSYDMSKCLVERIENIPANELQFVFPQMSNASSEKALDYNHSFTWLPNLLSEADYLKKFSIVHQNMLAGNSYLANLTCKIPIKTDLTLHEIFCRSKALYKIWLKDSFVCFSPETFVRIDNKGVISSCPMKGTISCSVPNARQVLMSDVKEAAEHATIVDLIRNDLSKVANHVSVKRYRYVEKLHTNCGDILQTSSEIVGQLPSDYRNHLGDIIMDQLPAGSITGAPKRKTIEIIRQAEDYDRDFYTGVGGVCNDGVIDSCVLIRFIDNENGRLFFKAGGGITAKSDWKKEYQEIKEKTYVPFC
ncbi:MAG: aminodeoxychorismate synthase component I [Prevotella sp.]